MHPLQEQFKSNTLAQLNSQVLQAGRIAGNLLEISHEIGVLNVRTSKASAEALAGAVQKLLAASNPVEFLQLAATVMRPDPQVWSTYANQLRGIAGKMVAPVTEKSADAAAVAEAPAAPLDLQGVVPPAAMEVVAQEPPLPVEAEVTVEAEMPAETKVQAQPDAAAAAAAGTEAAPEVQKVAQAIDHVAKSAPVISAAATQDLKSMAKAAVVPKAAVKGNRAQPMQKSVAPGKSAGRSRKG